MSPRIVENANRWTPVFWRVVQTAPGATARAVQIARPLAAEPDPPKPSPDAELETARKLEQARQSGIAEGIAQVQQQASAQTAETLERLAAGISALAQHRERITNEATQEVVQLATSIAARILSRELTVDPDAIVGLVKGALEKIKSRDLQRVRLHSSHAIQVRTSLDRLYSGSSVEIVIDPAAKPGDLFFETSSGVVDASVWTQLREIERGLTDRSRL